MGFALVPKGKLSGCAAARDGTPVPYKEKSKNIRVIPSGTKWSRGISRFGRNTDEWLRSLHSLTLGRDDMGFLKMYQTTLSFRDGKPVPYEIILRGNLQNL